MTTIAAPEPATARQPLRTSLLTLAAVLSVAAPVGVLAFMALVAAGDCALVCTGPQYGVAAACGLAGLVLLGCPVVVGLTSWRGRRTLSLVVLGTGAVLSLLSVVLLAA